MLHATATSTAASVLFWLTATSCTAVLGIPDDVTVVPDEADANSAPDASTDASPTTDGSMPSDASDCLPPPSGMVAWWDGDTPGEPGRDILGTYSATSTVGFVSVMPGKVSTAIEFGQDDLLFLGSTPTPASFTLEGWVRVAVPDMDYIALYGQFGNAGLFLYGNRLTFWDGDEGSGPAGNLATSDDSLDDTNWHHIAVTWDDSNSIMRTYIDGSFQQSETSSADIRLPEPADMGGVRDNGTPVDLFAGFIDEFSVYNRVVTSNEIIAIFNADVSGKCKP